MIDFGVWLSIGVGNFYYQTNINTFFSLLIYFKKMFYIFHETKDKIFYYLEKVDA